MKLKFKPFFKDVALTLATQAIVMLSFLLIYRLIAQKFGAEGLGEYTLVKKVVGLLQPVLLLGVGVGIPRYIAMCKNDKEKSSYLMSGGVIAISFTLIFLLLGNIFKEASSKIFFGSNTYAKLIPPLSFFLTGLILHSLIYSYFRGKMLIKKFNLLQIINLSLLPIAILIFFKNITLEKLVTAIGATTITISLTFLFVSTKKIFTKIDPTKLKTSFKKLLKYGAPRMPGDLALGAILSLGPIFAAHLTSVKEAGYLSVGQSMLTLAGATVAPLSLILLPKVSNLVAKKNILAIEEKLNYLIGLITQTLIFISFQFIILSDIIIKQWLGAEFLEAATVMRIIFFASTFYVFYLSTRSILDATKNKPINAINIIISLGIFLLTNGIFFLIKPFSIITNISIAFMLSLICLGSLTYISVRKIYPEIIKKDFNYLWTATIINIPLALITYSLRNFLSLGPLPLIAFFVLLSIIYLLILWLLKMKWIKELPKKILINQ